MYKKLSDSIVCILLLFAFFLTSSARAASPEETIRSLVMEMKGSSSLGPLAKYMDWEGYFEKLPDEAKKNSHLSSPSSLQSYYTALAATGAEASMDRIKKEAKEAPNELRAQKQQDFELVRAKFEELTREQADRIASTTYTIGPAIIDGDKAKLEVIKAHGDHEETVKLHLKNRGGDWRIESTADLNPLSKDLSSPTPIGPIPDPSLVLSNF